MARFVAILLAVLAHCIAGFIGPRAQPGPHADIWGSKTRVDGHKVSLAVFLNEGAIGMRYLLAIVLLLSLPAGIGVAQVRVMTAPAPSAPVQQQPSGPHKDIVVEGTPDGPFPVTTDAKDYVDIGQAGIQASADAHFFSRCVKPIDNGSLHELIDGVPHREVRAAALNRIARNYVACYPGYDQTFPRAYDDCNERLSPDPNRSICQSFFDRGALVEKMLERYAPDLKFTTAQLFDPQVLARFHAREDAFDKTRSKGEKIYAEVSACVVALHPKTALSLLRSEPGSKSEGRWRAALLGTSPQCVGGAKQVTVDASQFRVFIADAVYSWTVALKGTESLIPYDSKTSLLR